jgi:hypothetical protein
MMSNLLTMRKLNLILILSFSFLFAAAQDQEGKTEVFRNSLKVNPLSFFSGTFQMSYERLIGSDKSLNFSAGLTYKDSEDENVTGYKGEFQFRYFILQRETPRANRRLYFAPFIFDQYSEVLQHNAYNGLGISGKYQYDVNSFGTGIVMGVNWVFSKRFVIDAFIGGGVRTSNARPSYNNYFIDDSLFGYAYKGIFPRIGLDLGFTF